jgi:hypothetical protein
VSDPIETQMSALRRVAQFQPADPAVVRRRGDRLHRRATARKASGAALALALIATPLLSLNRHAGPGEPSPTRRGLVAGDALSLTDLPQRSDLGAWKRTPASGPALACVPARTVDRLGANETLERRYGAYTGHSTPGQHYDAQVRETVLAFADPASAKAASTTVTRRLRTNCAATDLAHSRPIKSQIISGPGEGVWELYVRTADQVCTECDAVYFDREAVLRVGDRLVLLSLNEAGGPLEPKGLDASMHQLTTSAATRAKTQVDPSGG